VSAQAATGCRSRSWQLHAPRGETTRHGYVYRDGRARRAGRNVRTSGRRLTTERLVAGTRLRMNRRGRRRAARGGNTKLTARRLNALCCGFEAGERLRPCTGGRLQPARSTTVSRPAFHFRKRVGTVLRGVPARRPQREDRNGARRAPGSRPSCGLAPGPPGSSRWCGSRRPGGGGTCRVFFVTTSCSCSCLLFTTTGWGRTVIRRKKRGEMKNPNPWSHNLRVDSLRYRCGSRQTWLRCRVAATLGVLVSE